MRDDVMMNKAAVIERSLRRIVELYAADPALEDLLYLDALTLNVDEARLVRRWRTGGLP